MSQFDSCLHLRGVALPMEITQPGPSYRFNAPVQLIGQSTGKLPLKRFAVAPVKDHTEKTRDIWLTVLPSKPVEAKKP